MASIITNYIGLTRVRSTLAVGTDTATFPAYVAAIAAAEGLSSTYYFLSLARDPSINMTTYPTETFDEMGITIEGDTIIAALVSDTGLTKEQKQDRKLAIASAARAQDSRRYTLDKTQLPNPYNGNVVDPDENANVGGLITGRPWV